MMRVKNNEQQIKKMLFGFMAISILVRGVLAAWLEFGNDEVYYWTYALYPDWSHFDHPPMVGWMIQLFSLNLLLDSEFFIRLASVVLMTVNTYVIFRIGKDIKDDQTGFYAALLYTASIYAFVITGVFIMPDTPLMLFWLLAFWMAVRFDLKKENKYLVLFGLFAGLAMLSKYSGAFLWGGMGLYVLLFDRKRLKNPYLYLAALISAICCLPILYWNMKNEFISFGFHSDRVGLIGKFNINYLLTEIVGESLQNNPVNYVLVIIAMVATFRGKIKTGKPAQRLLLCMALPMILLFLFFSLTRPVLPHWNAPAYCLLIVLTSIWLSERNPVEDDRFAIPRSVVAAVAVLLVVVVVGSAEIKTGFIPLDRHTEPEMVGREDFTVDMYGWRQLGTKFEVLRQNEIAEGRMNEEDGIIGSEWFPLANLDYYVARPLGMRVMALGWASMLHKYIWINEIRGGFHQGESYWFITESRYLKDPNAIYQKQFEEIRMVDTIPVERCGKTAKNFFVYSCKNFIGRPKTKADFMAQM